MGSENSPVKDSQSNGAIERGIQSIEGQVRTLISALQARLGVRISPDDCVLPWLIQHAGETLSHHQVGSDGKVPYQRLRGRKLKRHLVEFGEKIMWQPLDQLKQGSLNPRWIEGVWLGIRPRTSEVIVGTSKGVFKTRSFRRVPENERWSADTIKALTGVPWKTSEFEDSDKLRIRFPDESEVMEDKEAGPIRGEDVVPRKFAIQKKDLEQYGYTAHCGGCYAAKNNKSHKQHSHECRERVMKHLEADDSESRRVLDHRDRENRWLEKQVELADQQSKTPDGNNREEDIKVVDDNEPNYSVGTPSTRVPLQRYDEPDDTTDFYMEVNDQIN